MDLRLDASYSNLPPRTAAAQVAAADAGAEVSRRQRPEDPRKVNPVAETETVQAVVEDRLRDGKQETAAKADEDTSVAKEPAGGSYDRKLNYDKDVNRLFLDIVDTDSDETIMSIPPKELVRYFEETKAFLARESSSSQKAAGVDQSA